MDIRKFLFPRLFGKSSAPEKERDHFMAIIRAEGHEPVFPHGSSETGKGEPIPAEDKYRMFIANTSEGISLLEVLPPADINLPLEEVIDYIYDHAVLTECNDAFLKMYSLKHKDEVIGRKLIDFHGGRDNAANREEMRRFVRNSFRVINDESQEPDANGHTRYFSNSSIGIIRDGFLVSIWGTQTDITSLREKEIELVKARDKAEQSNRLKTAFLNNMSHEIRTPLNGIVGFSQLLSTPDLPDNKRSEYASIVANCSTRLIDILTDVTEMSKIQSGKMILNYSPVNIVDCILSSVLSYRAHAKVKNIGLDYRLDIPEEKKIIISDHAKLKRIISHLIDNAIKFTFEGSVEITCNITGGTLLLIVSDTGTGIPKENLPDVFEPFRQFGNNKLENPPGNGLGLSIVKAYVEAMSGNIKIDSEPERGTKIYITLPSAEGGRGTAPGFINPERPAEAKENMNRILIAEDEDINFIYLREILHSGNTEIIHAENGKCAVDICRANNDINLVLMDLKMPVLDGNEAARQIRQFRPELPIIAHTAYTPDNSAFTLNLFDDYIPKPARVEVLRKKLTKYIKL